MAAWIAGGAAIVGDLLSNAGQQSTNAQATANMMQQENWQEQMANTAMQRRVTDLKQAGLNPMLAVSSNGAQVGGVGQASLSNPDASFSQVGGQIASAMQLNQQQSQIEATQAQAAKTRADAAIATSQLPYSGEQAKASLDNLQVQTKQAWNASALLEQQYAKTGAELEQLNRNNNFQQQFLDLRNQMMAVDFERGKLGLPKLENDAAWQQAHPTLSGWLQSGAAQGVSSMVGSAATAARMGVP